MPFYSPVAPTLGQNSNVKLFSKAGDVFVSGVPTFPLTEPTAKYTSEATQFIDIKLKSILVPCSDPVQHFDFSSSLNYVRQTRYLNN